MSKLVLNLAIDVSGQPYTKIYVGLISIKADYIRKFEKEFKNKLPKFYRYKEKGTKRSSSELKNIISFMNDKNYIKMYTISLDRSDWQDFKTKYGKISYLIEKVYSLLYSYLFTKVCFKFTPYNAIVCEESYLNINRLINYCDRLNKYFKRNVILSKGNAQTTFLIRLGDFIASSHRKVDKEFLKKLKNYRIYKTKSINHKVIEKTLKK